jgi:diguanylate cyclase
MPAPKNPTEIARETLKLLAARRLIPTPENYQRTYNEIAGIPHRGWEQAVEQALHKVFRPLAKNDPKLAQGVEVLERALEEHDIKEFEGALSTLVAARKEDLVLPWAGLIRELIKQWELRHGGLTAARKKEGLERVLTNFGSDPAVLYGKLQALVEWWAQNPLDVTPLVESAPAEPATEKRGQAAPRDIGEALAPANLQPLAGKSFVLLRDILGQTLERGVGPRLSRFPDLEEDLKGLAKAAREARDQAELEKLSKELKQFWLKVELHAGEDGRLLEGLRRLLRLLLDNIAELLLDDQWLRGQIAVMQRIISRPLDIDMIEDAERSFKEVIFKQGTLKHSLNEAKTTLKNMIATFIDRLGEMSENTGEYHKKIEGYARRISQTEDIVQLNAILSDILKDTKGVQMDMLRSRDDLIEAQVRVEEAERKIRRLEAELEQVSEKVREDQLTGTLNRRGLEDAFQRELARAGRLNSPLSIAVMDVDNFKRLNDTYGHQAGDEALVHLVKVVKEFLRPSDVIGRYGGEEFVIILPDTKIDEAVGVMVRLQRELTKKFFLHKNERLLITFSAGVAAYLSGEPPESTIARADEALYQAKAAGKNRVFAAKAPSGIV